MNSSRACTLISLALGMLLSANADEPVSVPQITQLIRELDSDSFQDRESAHRKLSEIGRPAMAALRVATRDHSAEVRHRAKAILCRLLGKELEGVWQSKDQVLVVLGNHWWWGTVDELRPAEYDKNSYCVVDVTDNFFSADLLVGLGGRKGQVCKTILRIEGNSLHYSGLYESRPMGLTGGSGYEVQWKRATREYETKVLRGAMTHSSPQVRSCADVLLQRLGR